MPIAGTGGRVVPEAVGMGGGDFNTKGLLIPTGGGGGGIAERSVFCGVAGGRPEDDPFTASAFSCLTGVSALAFFITGPEASPTNGGTGGAAHLAFLLAMVGRMAPRKVNGADGHALAGTSLGDGT